MIACGGDEDLPDTGELCCYGAAVYGPERCTCWKPEYDLEQHEPDVSAIPDMSKTPCADCAYRGGSPERRGDPKYSGDQDELDDIVNRGDPFWCHQGMRRPVLLRHPCGMEIPGHPAAYDPPIVDGRPYRADGTPASLCAGWRARRRKLMREMSR